LCALASNHGFLKDFVMLQTRKATWLQYQMSFRFFGYSQLFFPIFIIYECHPTKFYNAFWRIFTGEKRAAVVPQKILK
jgi:hypothetical protein